MEQNIDKKNETTLPIIALVRSRPTEEEETDAEIQQGGVEIQQNMLTLSRVGCVEA